MRSCCAARAWTTPIPTCPCSRWATGGSTGVDWAAADLASCRSRSRCSRPTASSIRPGSAAQARLIIDTRNLTGPLGAQPHVIRL